MTSNIDLGGFGTVKLRCVIIRVRPPHATDCLSCCASLRIHAPFVAKSAELEHSSPRFIMVACRWGTECLALGALRQRFGSN